MRFYLFIGMFLLLGHLTVAQNFVYYGNVIDMLTETPISNVHIQILSGKRGWA